MQLVYLWVAEYKNIKNKGFNFSPDFECKYDEKSNVLTIYKDENYQPIFPSNINVTAIVGENGSGKSSFVFDILRLITGGYIDNKDLKNKLSKTYKRYK